MSLPSFKRLNALGSAAGSIAVLGGFVALWWLASQSGWVNRAFLPSPADTLGSLVQGLAGGDLLAYTWATLQRMLIGWVLASALGIALGALIGSSRAAREWIAPTLAFIRPLPASAVMPLASALFGLSEDHCRAFISPPSVIVRFTVREIFLQTPGPGAGHRVFPPEGQ